MLLAPSRVICTLAGVMLRPQRRFCYLRLPVWCPPAIHEGVFVFSAYPRDVRLRQVWEEWRDEERKRGGLDEGTSTELNDPFPSATRLSCADVVLCSLERLADAGGTGGLSADVRLARSVKWSQVRPV